MLLPRNNITWHKPTVPTHPYLKYTHTHTHLRAYPVCVTDRVQPPASTPLGTNYLDTLIRSYRWQYCVHESLMQWHLLWLNIFPGPDFQCFAVKCNVSRRMLSITLASMKCGKMEVVLFFFLADLKIRGKQCDLTWSLCTPCLHLQCSVVLNTTVTCDWKLVSEEDKRPVMGQGDVMWAFRCQMDKI